MADTTVDRFGVDVSVDNFAQFEKHMGRVNEILGAFGQKANQFAADAAIFDRAIQSMRDAGNKAKEAIGGLTGILRSGVGDTRTLGNQSAAIKKIADAYRDLADALNKLKSTPTDIGLPSLPRATPQRSAATAQPKETGPPRAKVSDDAVNALASRVLDQMVAADQARKNFVANTRADVATQQQLFQNLVALASGEESKFFSLLAKLQADATAANAQALQSFARGVTINTAAANQQARDTVQAASLTQKQQEVADAIRRRMADRRIADEERFAETSRKVADQVAAVHQKAFQDDAKVQAQAAKEAAKAQSEAQSKAQTGAGQANRVDAAVNNQIKLIEEQKRIQLEALDAALLKTKDDAARRKQIEQSAADAITGVYERASQLQQNFSEAALRTFKNNSVQIINQSRAARDQIESSRSNLASQDNTRALGRAFQRNNLAGATLEQFNAGRFAQQLQSDNAAVRTYAQSWLALSNTIAVVKFNIQNFISTLQTVGNIIAFPFKVAFSAINLVITVVEKLISILGVAGSVASAIAAPFKAIGGLFSGKQAKQVAPQAQAAQAPQGVDDVGKSAQASSRSIEILSGNTIKLGGAFSFLYNNSSRVSQNINNSKTAIDSFNSTVTSTDNSVRTFAASFNPVTAISNAFSASLSAIIGPAQSANTQLAQMQTQASGVGEGFSRTGVVVNEVLGHLIADGITHVLGLLKDLGGEAIQALGEFESLQTSFKTLSLREVLDSQPALSFADAEGVASKQAQDLLEWTQKLAIISPFSEGKVADIFKTAQAYDFTSKQAQILTQSVVDFATGTGQSAEAGKNVVVALGQIQAAGKLTGQELRQLTNNGVPALRILADATGQTTEQLHKFLQEGGSIASSDVITAITKSLGTEFAGAAARSSTTIEGLISSLQDLKAVGLRELILPAAQQIGEPLAAAITGALQDPAFIQGIRDAGQVISDSIGTAMNTASSAIGMFLGLVNSVPAPMITFAKNVLLGAGAILSLNAALVLLTPILSTISTVVATIVATVSSPIALVVAALAALYTAWQYNFLGMQDTVLAFVDQATTYLQTLVDSGLAYVEAGIGSLVSFFQNGGLAQIPSIVSGYVTSVGATFQSLVTQAQGIGASLMSAWNTNFLGINATVTSFVAAATSTFQSLYASLQSLTESGLQGVADLFRSSGLPQIPNIVAQIAQDILNVLSDLISSVSEYGAGIVQALADGITSAVGVVVDALNYLGSAITGLLETHSPPKLLPDLTKWGTGAADAYLEGWTKADFGLFDDLSGQIDKVLKAMGGNQQSPEFVKNVQEMLAQATGEFVSTGKIAQDTLDGIRQKFGGYGEEVTRIIAATVNAAAAAKQLEAAQTALSDATKKYQDQLEPIDDQLKKIKEAQDALGVGNEQKKFQNVLQNRFATNEQKQRAQMELDRIALEQKKKAIETERDGTLKVLQGNVDSAQVAKDNADKQLSVTQARFDQEFKLLGVLQQQASAAGGAADAVDRLKKGLKGDKPILDLGLGKLEDLKLPDLKLDDKLSPAIQAAKDRLEEGKKSILDTIQGIRDAFSKGLSGESVSATSEQNDLGQQVTTIPTRIEEIANGVGKAVGFLKEKSDLLAAEFAHLQSIFSQGFGGSTESGGKGQEQTQLSGIDSLVQKAGEIAGQLNTKFTAITTEVSGFATTFAAAWAKTGTDESGKNVVDRFIETVNSTEVQGKFQTIHDKVVTEINGLFGSSETSGIDWSAITASLQTTLDSFQPAVDTLKTNISSAIDSLFGEGTTSGITTQVQASLDLLFGDVKFEDLSSSVANFTSGVKTALSGIDWTTAIDSNVFGGLSTALNGLITLVIKPFQDYFSGQGGIQALTDIQTGVANIVSGIGTSIVGLWNTLSTYLATVDLSTQIASAAAALSSLILGAIGGIFGFVVSALSSLGGGTDRQGGGEGGGLLTGGTAETIAATISGAIISTIVGVMSAVWAALTLENITKAVTGIVEIIASLGGILVGIVAGVLEGAFNAISKIAEDVNLSTALTTSADAIVKFVSDGVGAIWAGIKSYTEGPLKTAQETIDTAASAISDAVSHPIDTIISAFNAIKDKLAGLADFSITIPGIGDINPFSSGTESESKVPVTAEVTKVDTTAIAKPENAPAPIPILASVDPALAQQAGKDLQAGVSQGVVAAQAEDTSQQSYWDKFTSYWGIKSPSTLANETIGFPIGQGIVMGIQAALDAGVITMTKLLASLTGGSGAGPGGEAVGSGLEIAINLAIAKIQLKQDPTVFAPMAAQINSTLATIDWTSTITSDTWMETYAITVEDTMRNIDWTGTIVQETWQATFTVTVESVIRSLPWTEITQQTFRSLVARVNTVLSSLPWTEITKDTFRNLVKRVESVLSDLDWDEITKETFNKLKDRVIGAIESIDWSGITTATFDSLGKTVKDAIEGIQWNELIDASSFDGFRSYADDLLKQTISELFGDGQEAEASAASAAVRTAKTLDNSNLPQRAASKSVQSAIQNAFSAAAKAFTVATNTQAISNARGPKDVVSLDTRQRTLSRVSKNSFAEQISAREFADDFLDRLFDSDGLGYKIDKYLEPPTRVFSNAVNRLVASFAVSSGKFGSAGDNIVNLIAAINPLVVSLNALVSSETKLTASVDALIGKIKAANQNNDPNGPVIIGGPVKNAALSRAQRSSDIPAQTATAIPAQRSGGLSSVASPVSVGQSTKDNLVGLRDFMNDLLNQLGGSQNTRSSSISTVSPVTLSQAPAVTINNTYVLQQTVTEATAAKSATSFGILKTMVGR